MTTWLKRLIGLGGETVEFRENRVLIDGRMLPLEPVKSGARELYLVGDKRDGSLDSRILGKVIATYARSK